MLKGWYICDQIVISDVFGDRLVSSATKQLSTQVLLCTACVHDFQSDTALFGLLLYCRGFSNQGSLLLLNLICTVQSWIEKFMRSVPSLKYVFNYDEYFWGMESMSVDPQALGSSYSLRQISVKVTIHSSFLNSQDGKSTSAEWEKYENNKHMKYEIYVYSLKSKSKILLR